MKTISGTEEFLAIIGSDGKVTENVKLAEYFNFYDLTSLTSLEGVTMGAGCRLSGLPDNIQITVENLTEEEKQKLNRIPLDHLNMSNWRDDCGTAYCLAGWMETFYPDPDKNTLEIGLDHLPNVGHLFYAPTKPVRKWLESLRDQENCGGQ